jgi:dipeptidyl aminopeptidase/acylaminoacyl peptidase
MSGNGTFISSKLGLVGAGVLILAGLAGCVEDETGPQFANNPPTATTGPTSGLPTTVPATPNVVATPVAATPVAIEDVLGTRGAVQRIFLASTDTIWAVNDNGDSEAILEAEPDEQILAIGTSPDATRVAAIIAWDNGRESSLVIVDANGDLVEELDLPAEPSATPVRADTGAGNSSVDWSPQGDKILLLSGNGALLTVAVDPDPTLEPVNMDVGDSVILEPAWSPTGQQIAFLRVDPGTRARSLALHDLQSGETTEVVGSADGRIVVEFAWEPGGKEILFTEGSALNSATTGIDLWRIGADGRGRELVAAAGAAAPVARSTTVTPSPDGKAYVVLVPGSGSPTVDSVWIRDLTSDQGIRLGLPSVRSVENIWWTSKGLAIATVADRRNEPILAVLVVTPNGNVSALWAEPLRAASPVPIGSPVPDDEG